MMAELMVMVFEYDTPQCSGFCGNCKYGQGAWKENGICYAFREQVWIPGAPHRKAGEEG